MKAWLRRYLGHDDLVERHEALLDQTLKFKLMLDDLLMILNLHNAALGRLIAKIDPLFPVPEDDPARKKASDELDEKVIEKLKAEQAVLEKYGYKPTGEDDAL